MKLVGIWNPKGGQGKSLLAINLAAATVELGLKPLVICQDQQGTALLFYQEGNLPFEVISEIPQTKPDVDIIFFDYQASDWSVPSQSLLVMPLKPERSQYATYIDAYNRAASAGKEVITVVTDGQSHRAEEKKTSDALKEKGAFIIPASGVFSRAASEYRTIFDPALNKAYKVKERRQEMSKILGKLLMEGSNEQ